MPRRISKLNGPSVFFNVPFDDQYEKLFVAAVAATVALGCVPRCVLELPELGKGRLSRLVELIEECPVSVHDLSRVGLPARFNMPFELGLAFSQAMLSRKRYSFVLLERKQYRLDKTLSDIKGRDPQIHGGAVKKMIACLCDALPIKSGAPGPDWIFRDVYRELARAAEVLKKQHSRDDIFSRTVFNKLVAAASDICVDAKILKSR